jgi:hypothetical protein
VSQHQEHLVLIVPAPRQVRPWRRQIDHLGVGQELRQQILLLDSTQPELGMGQNAQQLHGHLLADQGRQPCLPRTSQPRQTT